MQYLPKFHDLLKLAHVNGFIWDDYLIFIPTKWYKKNLAIHYPTPLNDQLLNAIPESLTQFIDNRSDRTILMSVKDDAAHQLDTTFKNYMKDKGSHIDELSFRGSYAAVMQNGKLVKEKIGQDEQRVEIKEGLITIKSAGRFAGNFSSILVEDKEYSINKRGINIAILEQGEVIEIINYDTYSSIFHNRNYKKLKVLSYPQQ